jgi:HAE1 family hydrophobic/amphiphilic exporter-1
MTAPVGRVKGALDEQNIRLVGRIERPADFNDIVIKRQGEEIVRLGQVATVQDGFAEPTSYSLRNGHPNVSLSIIRSREASTVAVAERVRKEVAEINKTLPEGTKLEVTLDGGDDAASSLGNVIHALVFGAGLTIFVVYVFLNSWRSTLITSLSLPTSAIAAFIAVWLCGFTLNFMTLLGLTLAIGVLIDDAIVVRENIVRHMERGADRVTAARTGTAEIGLAVTATTMSIVAVFVPVAFMGGTAGEWFRPFAVTVAASVLVSLLVSFTVDPMLSAYWGDARPRPCEAPRHREVFPVVQSLVRSPGRSLRRRHLLGIASSQVDGSALSGRLRDGAGAARHGWRQRIPAEIRFRHARGRGSNSLEREPRVRARQGGAGCRARPLDPRGQGHQHTRDPRGRARLRRCRRQ